MVNKTLHLLLFNSLIISLILLALVQNGFAGFDTIAINCCQISENECADNSEGPILCMEGNLQEDAFCDESSGRCRTELTPIQKVNPIPTLTELGVIAMAGILGIVAFIAIRRRKANA